MTDNLTLLRELNRIKVMFQQRAVCAAIGIDPETHAQPTEAGREDDEVAASNHFGADT